MDGRVFHLKNLFLNNLAHHWTIQEMALKVQLSPPHLQKLFKSSQGISPYAYLQELRLQRVRELLETTFFQVKQIGVQTGLTNDTHLSRDFKKAYGVTTTEYRRNYWDNIQAEELAAANNLIRHRMIVFAKK